MIIGVPKEIKNNEYRVAVVPSGVKAFVRNGHTVLVQKGAGIGSGIMDKEYEEVGGKIIDTAKKVWDKAEMIIKVKEPLKEEYQLIQERHIFFTYFHFASSEQLTKAMIKRRAVCIAYETIETSDRRLPLLTPMSEVAGRMSIQEGAKYLERPQKGRGVLLGGVPGVEPAEVLIIGGGTVGTNAAKMAAGMGAKVTIMDVNVERLRYLDDVMPPNVVTMMSNEYNVRQKLVVADLVVGAVLVTGARAPVLITRDMLKLMKPGAVIVDVAIDQGGCFETSKPTTHSDPVYIVDDVVHYCVANMPGAVARTSTYALTNATFPYALQIANKGYKKAILENREIEKGLNMIHGKVTQENVAKAFGLKYCPVKKCL